MSTEESKTEANTPEVEKGVYLINGERYLAPWLVAKKCHVSEMYLWNLRKKGGGPKYIKLSTIRYKESDVDAWIKSLEVETKIGT